MCCNWSVQIRAPSAFIHSICVHESCSDLVTVCTSQMHSSVPVKVLCPVQLISIQKCDTWNEFLKILACMRYAMSQSTLKCPRFTLTLHLSESCLRLPQANGASHNLLKRCDVQCKPSAGKHTRCSSGFGLMQAESAQLMHAHAPSNQPCAKDAAIAGCPSHPGLITASTGWPCGPSAACAESAWIPCPWQCGGSP